MNEVYERLSYSYSAGRTDRRTATSIKNVKETQDNDFGYDIPNT